MTRPFLFLVLCGTLIFSFNSKAQDYEFHNLSEADFALLGAAEEGNLDSIKAAIKRGANINAQGYNDETPLLLATQNADSSIVAWLIWGRCKSRSSNGRINCSIAYCGCRFKFSINRIITIKQRFC
jgi:ankyrin repeat protein